MENKKVRTSLQIKIEINETEKKLKALREEFVIAEEREYKEALEEFVKRFHINKKEDVDRISSLLESMEDIFGKQNKTEIKPEAVRDAVKKAVKNPEPQKENKAEKPSIKKSIKKPERVEEELPKEQDNPNPIEKTEPPVKKPEPKPEPPQEEDLDFSAFADIFADEPEDDAVNVQESVPEKDKEQTATPDEPKSVAPTNEQDNEDYDFADIFGNDEFDDLDDEKHETKAAEEPSYDKIDSTSDNGKINVSDVIMIAETESQLAQFKKKNTVVQAENKLLSAISAAVDEGWVRKGAVLEYFFDGEKPDYAKQNFYTEAGNMIDSIKGVFEEHDGYESADLFESFYMFPYQIRGKALALAYNDLEKYLNK